MPLNITLLSINGVALESLVRTVAEVPSVSIDGTTLSWTETDGTTLQFSDDLKYLDKSTISD